MVFNTVFNRVFLFSWLFLFCELLAIVYFQPFLRASFGLFFSGFLSKSKLWSMLFCLSNFSKVLLAIFLRQFGFLCLFVFFSSYFVFYVFPKVLIYTMFF